MMTLTRRQKNIYDYLVEFINQHGYAPSYREIAEHFDLKSVGTVADHIETLRAKGVLQKNFKESRSLQLTPAWEDNDKEFEVPLLGRIAAGAPIEAIRTHETITIPRDMMGHNVFALKVRGESMVGDGIYDGDYVIIEQTNRARNGDIVVALIDNDSVTLKRFFREKDHIRLQPANSRFNPIRSKKVVVQGRVKGIIRKFA